MTSGVFKPSEITTTSRWRIGSYYWTVTTRQSGVNGYGGFDCSVTGVSLTLGLAKRAVRRVERRRDAEVRRWILL